MKKLGFSFLSAKTLSVLAAAFGSLLHTDAEAQTQPVPQELDTNTITSYSEFQKKILKPKLVIKLNVANPDNSLLAFHRSHSSHSSHSSHYSSSSSGHSSHSSHSSHASHYSGSTGSYSPSYTPTPTHHPAIHSGASQGTENASSTSSANGNYTLGSRVLYKGCRGSDVKELQQMLSALSYRLLITGYFGDQTEAAVIKFQKANELEPNGKVDTETLKAIQSKINGR